MAKDTRQLLLLSIIVGGLVGALELFIGHRYILEPLLSDQYFVAETFFAPTYYGLIKSIVVAISFYAVYATDLFNKIKINKAIITGIVGALAFGLYYMYTRTAVSVQSGALIFFVHYAFISGISYFVWNNKDKLSL